MDHEHLWDDDPRVMRQFRRSWRGMPLRSDWNNRPYLAHCKQCIACGYRFYSQDFTYRGKVLVNGQPAPLMEHETCWNCFMWDTDPGHMEACFGMLERASVAGPVRRTPELKSVGGGR